MKQLRVYADTSVYGGCFDEEFKEPSRKFFEEVRSGRFVLVVSDTTLRELRRAPDRVRMVLEDISNQQVILVKRTKVIESLRDAYLQRGILGPSSRLDAEHIASASVARVDVIVSWNFRHIVHFDKIRGYHAVNLMHGYHSIPIHSPREVVSI